MIYYPVFLNLSKKKCVVVGGGMVAERKIKQLLRTGADITVVSPRLTKGLKKLSVAGRIRHKNRKYKKGDVRNAFLVIAATSSERINKYITMDTPGLVNAVDMPDYCSFIMPSVVRKGQLNIAISSSGISPALSKTLRKELEVSIPDELSDYLVYLKKIRPMILKSVSGPHRKTSSKQSLLLKELGSLKILNMLKRRGLMHVRRHINALIPK